MNEESLDIRVPIRFLLQHWMWVAATALVTGLAALGITLLLPVMYQAEATLAISPSRTEVQFDPRIVTLEEYDLARSTVESRRDSLVALVTSNQVVQAVLDDVGDQLQSDDREISSLRNLADVQTIGDLINIEVRYGDPEIATMLANTWAEHFERHVNQVYSDSRSAGNGQIVQQVEDARERYSAAQAALEAYEAVDPVEVLQRELDAKLAILENYQMARIASQTMPTDRNQEILNNFYRELTQIESLLADAEALREQVADDTGSSAGNLGNALALILLRSRAYGGNNEVSITTGAAGAETTRAETSGIVLQIDLSGLSAEEVQPADVDALIAVLESRRQAAQARVDSFLEGLQAGESQSQLSQVNERITEISAEVTALQGEIEAAGAELRELTQDRDNTWETYQLLLGRQVEEQITSQATSSEVRIADNAIVPTQPIGRGVVRNTFLATFVGAFVAAGIVMAYALWSVDGTLAGERSEHAPPVFDDTETDGSEDIGGVAVPRLPKSLSS